MTKSPQIARIAIFVAFLSSSTAFAADKVHLNQIGFGATASKQAVYNGTPTGTITIKSTGNGGLVKAIMPKDPKKWAYSGEANNSILDFSPIKTPGNYALYEDGIKISPTFKIGVSYDKLTRDALRFYYYHRADLAIAEPYAESFVRDAGHSGTQATVFDANRNQTSIRIKSHRGWYDAGDYGRYVVNSGITVYTLLALYEKYADKIPALNIPADEDIDELPDLLAEIKWNLDWMLTMQDASDGGVYHKMTTADFNYFGFPSGDGLLMVMGKTTAATLDFAAVMAVASRIYREFDETYANQMLAAAKKAWTYAKSHPKDCYDKQYTTNNDCNKIKDPTATGSYEDSDFSDEFFFAAAALATVVSAEEQTLLGLSDKITTVSFGIPGWQNVGNLGNYEIIKNKDKFSPEIYNKTLTALITSANTSLNNANSYGLPFDNIFWWGSNAVAGNTGIFFMELYEATKDIKYKKAAQAIFDYILGRNPIDQSYVTGYGSKFPQHLHDRLTDNWRRVFPGQLVGGASAQGCEGNSKNYSGTALSGTASATFYEDKEPCYGYNEIAINWNAPLAYLSAALSEAGDDTGSDGDGGSEEPGEGGGSGIATRIDDFENGSDIAITGEPWFTFVEAKGNPTASIDNESKKGGEVLNTNGYAELVNIKLGAIEDWDTDWAQATIALETKNNGTSYSLAQCSEGFKYKYKGNDHRFALQSEGASVIYYNDIEDYYGYGYSNSWTTVTVNYTDFIRDPYDGGREDIPLNLSKVEAIHWTVRPNMHEETEGDLKIKDFECLGKLDILGEDEGGDEGEEEQFIEFVEAFDASYSPTLKLSDIKLPKEYAWVEPTTALSELGEQSFAATYKKSIAGSIAVNVVKAKIAKPTAQPLFSYTGKERTAIAASAAYTVTSGSAINVGKYTATVVLNNDYYIWSDGTIANLTFEWEIIKGKITKPTVATNLVYTGGELSAIANPNAAYTVLDGTAIEVGNYTATVVLNDKENYTWSDGTIDDLTLPWKIAAATPISLPQVATGNIRAQSIGNVILLENLPKNTKVEVYNLQGKQIYSTHSENSKILKIMVQTGIYIVKIGNQTLRVPIM